MTSISPTRTDDRARKISLLVGLLALIAAPVAAQKRAVTEDDRKVLLWPDGSWTYADQLRLPAQPIVLPTPPLDGQPAPGKPAARHVRLRQISVNKNNITDDEAWFRDNRLSLPTCEVPRAGRRGTCPARTPAAFQRSPLNKAIIGRQYALLLYGGGRYRESRYLVIADRTLTKAEAVFDFGGWLRPPAAGQGRFTTQELTWAARVGHMLYVSNGHRTYAKSSRGKNAYLSAIDLETNRLRWRSPPLTCNASTFVVIGDHIVCGYGFTAEPDFLYAFDRHSGRVVAKHKLKSGPSTIIEQGGRIYVRTYDRDYVFALEVR